MIRKLYKLKNIENDFLLKKLKKMFYINLAELVSTISAVNNRYNVMCIYRPRNKIEHKYSLQLRFCKIKTTLVWSNLN